MLMTHTDIAKKLGYTPNYTRDKIVTRVRFPRPAIELSQKKRLWDEQDIDRWLKSERDKINR
jgi:predicted DNA-binding transcriptional regulator AlpA